MQLAKDYISWSFWGCIPNLNAQPLALKPDAKPSELSSHLMLYRIVLICMDDVQLLSLKSLGQIQLATCVQL